MTKTIEIVVFPQGETKIETKGFAGAECQEASKYIEQALGRRAQEKLTAEFHTSVASQQNRTQQHG